MKSIIVMTLSVFVFSVKAKVLVISDIDDTIKKANSTNSVSVVWYFLKADPYVEMSKLYNEIKTYYESQGEEVEFLYLSAAYDATFNQEKWLDKHNFPFGRTILRKIGDGKTYQYKYRSLKSVLSKENSNDLKLFLFGDNSDQDPKVYHDVVNDMNIIDSQIYIRDVSTYATYWQTGWEIQKIPGLYYFFSEMELRDFEHFYYLSNDILTSIEAQYKSQKLIPRYTFKTLEKRIKDVECALEGILYCEDTAEMWAKNLWQDYHQRL